MFFGWLYGWRFNSVFLHDSNSLFARYWRHEGLWTQSATSQMPLFLLIRNFRINLICFYKRIGSSSLFVVQLEESQNSQAIFASNYIWKKLLQNISFSILSVQCGMDVKYPWRPSFRTFQTALPRISLFSLLGLYLIAAAVRQWLTYCLGISITIAFTYTIVNATPLYLVRLLIVIYRTDIRIKKLRIERQGRLLSVKQQRKKR